MKTQPSFRAVRFDVHPVSTEALRLNSASSVQGVASHVVNLSICSDFEMNSTQRDDWNVEQRQLPFEPGVGGKQFTVVYDEETLSFLKEFSYLESALREVHDSEGVHEYRDNNCLPKKMESEAKMSVSNYQLNSISVC
jgi:hypothetical protein